MSKSILSEITILSSGWLTGKLQTGSPAEYGPLCVVGCTLIHPCILVPIQTLDNEVAPRQTPPAAQSQIYEGPVQRPSVRANTTSVSGGRHPASLSCPPQEQKGFQTQICEVARWTLVVQIGPHRNYFTAISNGRRWNGPNVGRWKGSSESSTAAVAGQGTLERIDFKYTDPSLKQDNLIPGIVCRGAYLFPPPHRTCHFTLTRKSGCNVHWF